MTTYKVEIQYAEEKQDEFTIDDQHQVHWTGIPVAAGVADRAIVMRAIRDLCTYLRSNGGQTVEIVESE